MRGDALGASVGPTNHASEGRAWSARSPAPPPNASQMPLRFRTTSGPMARRLPKWRITEQM
eukprot:8077002-Pyramimonas_sp.AAC.1